MITGATGGLGRAFVVECAKQKRNLFLSDINEDKLQRLAESIRRSYGVEVKYTGSTPGDQFGIFGDNSHIKKELNWEPKIKLKAGLTLMYRWAIENI